MKILEQPVLIQNLLVVKKSVIDVNKAKTVSGKSKQS